jgi:hypothetical protein
MLSCHRGINVSLLVGLLAVSMHPEVLLPASWTRFCLVFLCLVGNADMVPKFQVDAE